MADEIVGQAASLIPAVSLGTDETGILRRVQVDVKSRVFAALDDEQVERVAKRVVELLREVTNG